MLCRQTWFDISTQTPQSFAVSSTWCQTCALFLYSQLWKFAPLLISSFLETSYFYCFGAASLTSTNLKKKEGKQQQLTLPLALLPRPPNQSLRPPLLPGLLPPLLFICSPPMESLLQGYPWPPYAIPGPSERVSVLFQGP